jgi:hypothetical protein
MVVIVVVDVVVVVLLAKACVAKAATKHQSMVAEKAAMACTTSEPI